MAYKSALAVTLFANVMLSAPPLVIRSPDNLPQIVLFGPESAEYLPAIEKLVGKENLSPLSQLLPYGMLIRNRGTQGIAATGVLFEITMSNGRTYKHLNRVVDLSSPESAFLWPGRDRFESPMSAVKWAVNTRRLDLFVRSEQYQHSIRKTAELSKAVRITASLDFAVLADGMFLGPDSSKTFQHLHDEASVRAEFSNELVRYHRKSPADLRAFLSEDSGELSRSVPADLAAFDYISGELERMKRNAKAVLDLKGADEVVRLAKRQLEQADKGIKLHK